MGSEREPKNLAFDAEPDGPRRSRVRATSVGDAHPLAEFDLGAPASNTGRPPGWVLWGAGLLAVGSAATAILSRGPIAVLGVLCFPAIAIALASWMVLNARREPWLAAGVTLAFVILGGFSIGLFLIPAFIGFVITGVFGDLQAGGAMGRHVGYC